MIEMLKTPYNYGQKNKTEQEIRLEPKFDTEEVSKSGHNLYKRRRVLDKKTTANAYEDSKIFDARFYKEKIVSIKNIHASNVAKYKVLGCIDPTIWHELVAEATLNAGASIKLDSSVTGAEELGKPLAFIKIQVASNVADTPATINAFIAGQS